MVEVRHAEDCRCEYFKDFNITVPEWMQAIVKNYNGDKYRSWGNYEDYMLNREGWEKAVELFDISELWELDDLNELVSWYFFVYVDSVDCDACNQTGYHPDVVPIHDSFYGGWEHTLTQEEVQALFDEGRLRDKTCPSAEEFNSRNYFHDAINSWILIPIRAKSQGLTEITCPKCLGHGEYSENVEVKLGLQMWFILPRKGCSRGVRLLNIEESDMRRIREYLIQARNRSQKLLGVPER